MACGDCTEFLVQGSGMVGSGSALAYEKIINFFDSDNIPLTVRSAEVLTKNGSPLVDTTPSWFGFETSAQSLLIDGVVTYRLTVTVLIDAVIAGAGTFNIRVCARVVDDTKAQICCSFDVCISRATATGGNVFFFGQQILPSSQYGIWSINPDAVDPSSTLFLVRAGRTTSGLIQYPVVTGNEGDGRIWFIILESGTYRVKSILPDGTGEQLEHDTLEIFGSNVPDLYVRSSEIVFIHAAGKHKRDVIPMVSPTIMITINDPTRGLAWNGDLSFYIYGNANLLGRRDRSGGSFSSTGDKCQGVAFDVARDKVYFRTQDASAMTVGIRSANEDLSGITDIIAATGDLYPGDAGFDYYEPDDWIYYCKDGTGGIDIWRIHPDGTGDERVFDSTVSGMRDIEYLAVLTVGEDGS